MATTTYLSQPAELKIATVDLTDQASSVTLTLGSNPLTSTAFGDLGERMVPGLQTVEGTITLYVSYGATEVEGVIAGEVGQGDTTIVVKKDAGAISASNPEWTISNTMIANYPITYTVGELQIMEISFSGGTWVRDVTP
jgi:hypothetical protein